ncbi:MAG: hypothetical protein IPL33_21880 [Sphingobacteriales bacterium]|nr:hypothetical protein [Sphingobacteriales bacterium]
MVAPIKHIAAVRYGKYSVDIAVLGGIEIGTITVLPQYLASGGGFGGVGDLRVVIGV